MIRHQNTLLILFLLLSFATSAQKQFVNGKITDARKDSALAGVSVQVRSSKIGTTTNGDGVFTVEAEANDVLEITTIGYNKQLVNINGRSEINISLDPSSFELSEVVLVGSRRAGRVKLETAVPVDVVNLAQVNLPTAKMDLTSILNYAAPSFNYNKQSGSDGADHIDLATLRGLGPDQTLVLVNGKRRHQTSFVAVFGTRGRGNSGTDLNAIPVSAIDRVEILRDGASAQYGSDAMAGVINLVLKQQVKQFSANVGYAGYYDDKYNTWKDRSAGEYEYGNRIDGNSFTFGANYGLPIGKKGGFINLSTNFLRSGKTFRQALDNDLTHSGSLPLNTVRRANGDGSLTTIGAFINLEIPIKNSTSFYAFGGHNYKASDAFAFTRNFSGRPERFPTNPDGTMISVPGIIKSTPGGEFYYNPHIQTKIKDLSLAAGIKGITSGNWNWDLSNTIGRNDFHFYGDKTFNASLGQPDKNHFDDGGFSFLQNTVNLNFSKEISGVLAGFNLAFGAEYRYENYKITAGEEASYRNYDPAKATGSQGFPGYQPSDEVDAHRSNVGAYIDAELDITNKFLLGGAVRFENYSDFGFTHNYKLSARYKVTDNFNLRGSVSTGFRAPSLQQINFSSTFTTVQGSTIAEVKIAPNQSPITKAAGIPDLKEEKSINGSLGFTFKPTNELSITLDGYWVKVKDRVVLSGQFSADDSTLDPSLIGSLKSLNVSLAQFFANAVNTTNKGIDLVIDYNRRIPNGSLRALLTGNLQHMSLDKINVPAKLNDTEEHRATFFSDREQKFVLASAPRTKFAFNLEYGIRHFTVGTRATYFGKIVLLGYGESGSGVNPMVPSDADPNVYVSDEYVYNGKLVNDLYASYRFSKAVSLYIGSDNIFNVHPDLGYAKGAKGWAYNNETGGPWDSVQMGAGGRRLFARLAFNF